MERIRYRKKEDGSLVSIQTFKHPDNGAEYEVVLNSQGYIIRDPNNNLEAAADFLVPKLNIKKKRARKALEALGIQLDSEKRAARKPKV